MAENSKIAWTTHTFNPWIGCTPIGPGCDHCYARAMMDYRFGKARWGVGEDRVRTSKSNWAQPLKWNRAALVSGERPFVFCASLADVFDNEVEEKWRRDLFDLIQRTPNLIWLLLTKRVGNVEAMTDPLRGNPMLPPNAAIGATFVNQAEYDRDRLKLYALKEKRLLLFTFGSFEPLIGPVSLDEYAPDWIICGGESRQNGEEPRVMATEWARGLRDSAKRMGRRFFMKQMTDLAPIPTDLMIRQYPELGAIR